MESKQKTTLKPDKICCFLLTLRVGWSIMRAYENMEYNCIFTALELCRRSSMQQVENS